MKNLLKDAFVSCKKVITGATAVALAATCFGCATVQDKEEKDTQKKQLAHIDYDLDYLYGKNPSNPEQILRDKIKGKNLPFHDKYNTCNINIKARIKRQDNANNTFIIHHYPICEKVGWFGYYPADEDAIIYFQCEGATMYSGIASIDKEQFSETNQSTNSVVCKTIEEALLGLQR